MKFVNNAILALVGSASAKLNAPDERKLQAVPDLTGIDLNSTEGLTQEQLEGIFGDALGGIMNGTATSGSPPAIPDLTGIDLNSTEGLTQEQLEQIFGSNITDVLSGLAPEGTPPPGFEDALGGLGDAIGSIFGGTAPTGMGMPDMICPDTCPASICDSMTTETAPTEEDLASTCAAGTTMGCFPGMNLICGGLCAEGADLTGPGWNAEGIESTCGVCDFLTCCDGVNTYDSCKALLPAEAFAGMGSATGTETGATAPAETVATDAPETGATAPAETVATDAPETGGTVATDQDGEDEDHDEEQHDDHDGHDHGEDEDEPDELLDEPDSDDVNAASSHLISAFVSVVSIGLFFNAL